METDKQQYHMADLTTPYLGLKLRNPLVVSSSGLADSADKVKKIAEAGAGAVVLKSLFEEQINYEAGRMIEDDAYPEAADYIKNYTRDHSLDEYLRLIENSRKQAGIPVIASINCISNGDWIDFAKQIESAGADALELNTFILPIDGGAPERIEQAYFDLLTRVRSVVSIPLAVKISPYFSNLIYMISRFYALGINGVVMFNRLYEPDIQIEEMKMTTAEVFSNPADLRQTLRWISLAFDRYKGINLSASTGIHSGESLIKVLLAGAQTGQVCSALYKGGLTVIDEMIADLEKWMDDHEFDSIDEFRGRMSYRDYENARIWERSQFMRYFSSRH